MKNIKIKNLDSVIVDRSTYNKVHKESNSSCSICKWNRGCNKHTRYYLDIDELKPWKTISWKLLGKTKTQWVKKDYVKLPKIVRSHRNNTLTEILI